MSTFKHNYAHNEDLAGSSCLLLVQAALKFIKAIWIFASAGAYGKPSRSLRPRTATASFVEAKGAGSIERPGLWRGR
jgi:hypothetical protein